MCNVDHIQFDFHTRSVSSAEIETKFCHFNCSLKYAIIWATDKTLNHQIDIDYFICSQPSCQRFNEI